jgi:hypothetical protein
MDEGTGSTTKDDAASNTGTITGATWKSESDGCPSGNCLYFDGTDYITTPSFALTGTVLTVTGWVKTTLNATIHNTILGENSISTSGSVWVFRWGNSNKLSFGYAYNTTSYTYLHMSTFFTGYDNAWVYFTVVADYSGTYPVKFYRNGELIQNSVMTGTPSFPSTSRIKYLGAYGPSASKMIDGNLDDIRIYNRELSASEIKAIYEGTK